MKNIMPLKGYTAFKNLLEQQLQMEQRKISRGSLSTRGRKRRHQIGASFSFIMDDSFITIEACRRHACSFQKRDN